MKKIVLSVAVCGALALTLFGCGQQASPESTGTDAPAQQEQPAEKQMTPEEIKAELSKLIENQPDNATIVNDTVTTVEAGGQSMTTTMSITAMADNTDGYKGYALISAPGTEVDGMETFMADGKVIAQFNGQVIDMTDQMGGQSEDPVKESNEQALQVVKAAKDITMTDNGGQKTFTITMDGDSAAVLDIDDIDVINDVRATYTFNAEGQLELMDMTCEGTTTVQDQEVTITVQSKAKYSDYGTTQVPAAPEV